MSRRGVRDHDQAGSVGHRVLRSGDRRLPDDACRGERFRLMGLEAKHGRVGEIQQRLGAGDRVSAILALEESPVRDQLQLSRMKKRKLQLKDMIARIETVLLPDIIA